MRLRARRDTPRGLRRAATPRAALSRRSEGAHEAAGRGGAALGARCRRAPDSVLRRGCRAAPPAGAQELKNVFEKLHKYIGKSVEALVNRPDAPHVFRLHKKVWRARCGRAPRPRAPRARAAGTR